MSHGCMKYYWKSGKENHFKNSCLMVYVVHTLYDVFTMKIKKENIFHTLVCVHLRVDVVGTIVMFDKQ